jgi:hypothetical protein
LGIFDERRGRDSARVAETNNAKEDTKMKRNVVYIIIGLLFLSGCAHLEFTDFTDGQGGVTYYDPKPYMLVVTAGDCATTAAVVVLPEKKRTVKFKMGYGSAKLSVGLSNGMFTNVGQETDTKIPETIGSITSLGTAISGITKAAAVTCTPSAVLYPVENGVPILEKSFSFPIKVNK